jgi:hypothetical protein
VFHIDFESETMPFIIEGQHTQVFGIGKVVGKIAVAQTPNDLLRGGLFDETGTIPVLLDEFAVTMDNGRFNEIARRLSSGLWAGFVTFGSSEMIKSHRRDEMPSHFMIALRGFADTEGFIGVIDNDENNNLADNIGAAMLRSELGMYHGMASVLKAVSSSKATIEFDIPE